MRAARWAFRFGPRPIECSRDVSASSIVSAASSRSTSPGNVLFFGCNGSRRNARSSTSPAAIPDSATIASSRSSDAGRRLSDVSLLTVGGQCCRALLFFARFRSGSAYIEGADRQFSALRSRLGDHLGNTRHAGGSTGPRAVVPCAIRVAIAVASSALSTSSTLVPLCAVSRPQPRPTHKSRLLLYGRDGERVEQFPSFIGAARHRLRLFLLPRADRHLLAGDTQNRALLTPTPVFVKSDAAHVTQIARSGVILRASN